MKITNSKEAFEIDTKRFYLPITIETVCPKCGEKVIENFCENYLMYPTANVPFEHQLRCSNEHEFDVKLTLSITIEEVKS